MTCSCRNSTAVALLLAALAATLPAGAARASVRSRAAQMTLGAQVPPEDVPEPDFEEDEEADSTALTPTTPTPIRGALPGDSTGISAGRDSTARADSSAQADSARVRAAHAAAADSAAAKARSLSARADSIRARRGAAPSRGAAVQPKPARNGILGIHPVAIVAGLVVLHVLVVRWIAD